MLLNCACPRIIALGRSGSEWQDATCRCGACIRRACRAVFSAAVSSLRRHAAAGGAGARGACESRAPIGACSRDLAALVALAGAGPGAQPPATAAPTPLPTRSPRNASYAISARLDPAAGPSRATSSSPGATLGTRRRRRCAFTSITTPGATPRSTWMRERRLAGNTKLPNVPRRLGLDRRDAASALIGAGGTPTDLTSRASVRRARRRQCGRSDRGGSFPSTRRWRPGQTINVQIAWSSRVPRTFARTGAIGNLLLRRAVVPQDRRARETAGGTATSSTPPPSSSRTSASTTSG